MSKKRNNREYNYDADAYYEEYETVNFDGGEYETTRPRKKRRKKHYFLRFLVFLAVLAGVFMILASPLFDIDEIDVKGGSRYTPEQIVEMSGIRSGENIFMTRMSKAEKAVLSDPYIETAEITRKLPHKIIISVKERTDGFCVLFKEKYYTLDSGGTVVAVADTLPNVTLIDGLGVISAVSGEKLEVEKNMLLADTILFLAAVRENGLYFKRIDARNPTVKAYFNDKLLCEGTYVLIEKDIAELKAVISDLQKREVKKGRIIVNGSGSCTFTPKI
jgi:cell division protein FtsQ